MKKLLFVIILASFSGYVSANEFIKLVGTWNYIVEYAPVGYDKGQMIFSENEGKVVGEVRIEGHSIPVKNLELIEGQFKFGVEIDYGYIPITIKIDGDKLTGKANTPDGDMPIQGTRAKPE